MSSRVTKTCSLPNVGSDKGDKQTLVFVYSPFCRFLSLAWVIDSLISPPFTDPERPVCVSVWVCGQRQRFDPFLWSFSLPVSPHCSKDLHDPLALQLVVCPPPTASPSIQEPHSCAGSGRSANLDGGRPPLLLAYTRKGGPNCLCRKAL